MWYVAVHIFSRSLMKQVIRNELVVRADYVTQKRTKISKEHSKLLFSSHIRVLGFSMFPFTTFPYEKRNTVDPQWLNH